MAIKMKIKEMKLSDIEARMAEIRTEMDEEGADIKALSEEVREMTERKHQLEEELKQKEALRKAVAGGAGTVIRDFAKENKEEKRGTVYNADSKEYRIAWLKNLAVRNNVKMFGDLTNEERTAFTMTTDNSGSVVPTPIINRIAELVESMSPIYDDAKKTQMTQGFGVPRHKITKQGDAKGVKEGTANEDAQEEFDLLTFSGVEIKKHLVMSRKMKFKSIEAFENWLVQSLSERVAVAKESVCIKRLNNEAPDGGSIVSNSGIDSGNIVSGKKYTDTDIRGIMAKLKGIGARAVYANSATIWNHLAGIEDGNHNKLFVQNSMVDPIVQGRIYGAEVKLDDNLPDNEVYFGVKGALKANDYDDMEIFHAIEPKTANDITTAYSLFDAALENPMSFVKATFSVGA